MKTYVMLAFPLLLMGRMFAQCPGAPKSHGQLQWSEAAKLVSPDRVWEIEVRPVLTSDENESPVQLRSCEGSSVSRTLLKLERYAEAYWRRDSKMLLMINQPVANEGKLLLFETMPISTKAKDVALTPDQINEVVKKQLFQELGENKKIEFYLPQFVSWRSDDLVIAVGGATTSGDGPAMTPYCFGFVIDSDARRVMRLLSANVLKAEFGKKCRVSP